MGLSTTGKIPPANEVVEQDGHVFDAANSEESLFSLTDEVSSILIQAHPSNAGNIYIGFDDTLTSDNGVVLEAGASLAMEMDTFNQQIYALADNVGDDVRYFSMK